MRTKEPEEVALLNITIERTKVQDKVALKADMKSYILVHMAAIFFYRTYI